ncbi:glycosyltransferase family 39 protein [Cohnella pontilimi]|uniref:Glycosyltransferase family 39 protein n=1 Tax=Cohnella pontilimi TaxID=2564100 RepID=A0A4U0FAW3_9BACL|nr:glycosyltransferase family 39 protein [Cohnella pontilimi]TJY41895.1 glycosyltransferase family 39 protein [Cohnella pontilimi]
MPGKRSQIGWAAAVVLGLAYAVFGAYHLSPWAAAWDEVDFVLALDRFDLLAMQPHAPGYPYFILGGRLMRFITEDPVRALGLWNLLLVCSSAYPIYRIARRWTAPVYACLAVALTLTLPMNWTLAVRPMSEGAALAILWWYLWTLVRVCEKGTGGRWLAAAFMFGLLMGTRLSYAPFGLGLLLVWILAWREREVSLRLRYSRAILWAGAAAAFQLLWVAGLAAAEGGIRGTMVLMAGFGEGHFTQWGGGVAQSGLPFRERFVRFVADNWLWSGMSAQSALLAVMAGLLAIAALVMYGKKKSRAVAHPKRREQMLTAAGLIAACALAYAVWALLGQNIAKPRHAAPLASLTIFALGVWAVRSRTRTVTALAVLFAAGQTAIGAHLVMLQHDQWPAVYQLADRLKDHPAPRTVVYTWEEERVLRYLNVPVQTVPIFTYEYFMADIAAQPSSRILLTGSVWEEFRRQSGLPESKVRLVGVFRSDPRLDPVYGTIPLYEWNREQ